MDVVIETVNKIERLKDKIKYLENLIDKEKDDTRKKQLFFLIKKLHHNHGKRLSFEEIHSKKDKQVEEVEVKHKTKNKEVEEVGVSSESKSGEYSEVMLHPSLEGLENLIARSGTFGFENSKGDEVIDLTVNLQDLEDISMEKPKELSKEIVSTPGYSPLEDQEYIRSENKESIPYIEQENDEKEVFGLIDNSSNYRKSDEYQREEDGSDFETEGLSKIPRITDYKRKD